MPSQSDIKESEELRPRAKSHTIDVTSVSKTEVESSPTSGAADAGAVVEARACRPKEKVPETGDWQPQCGEAKRHLKQGATFPFCSRRHDERWHRA